MKKNQTITLSITLIFLWAWAGITMATTCIRETGPGRESITLLRAVSLTVGRDVPVGTVIYQQSSVTGRSAVLTCEDTPDTYTSRHDVERTSTAKSSWAAGPFAGKVWETSVEGIGVAFRTNNIVFPAITGSANTNIGRNNCFGRRCVLPVMPSLNANIDLLLIKTSNVLPGTIQGSSLPTVTAYRDVGDASIPSLALSYSGSINIVSQTCRTPDVIVNLGTHKAFEFTGIGSFTAWTDFRINLNDCPMFHGIYNDAGAKVGNSISYRIDPIGTAVNAEQGILMINKGTGDKDVSANGVGVQVATNTGTVLPLAVIRPSEIALNTNIGSVSIPLRARYVQTSATVTPGPANASASFTIIYQ